MQGPPQMRNFPLFGIQGRWGKYQIDSGPLIDALIGFKICPGESRLSPARELTASQ